MPFREILIISSPLECRGLRDGAGPLRFSFHTEGHFTPSFSSAFAACFRFSNWMVWIPAFPAPSQFTARSSRNTDFSGFRL